MEAWSSEVKQRLPESGGAYTSNDWLVNESPVRIDQEDLAEGSTTPTTKAPAEDWRQNDWEGAWWDVKR